MNSKKRSSLLVEGWGTPWQRTTRRIITEEYGNVYNPNEGGPILHQIEQFYQEISSREDEFLGEGDNPGYLKYLDGLLRQLKEHATENETAKSAVDVIEEFFPGGFLKNLVYPAKDRNAIDMGRWVRTLSACAKNGDMEDCLKLANQTNVYFMGFDDGQYEKMVELQNKLFEMAEPHTPGDDSEPVLTTIAKLSTITGHVAYLAWAIYQGKYKLCNKIKESLNEEF